jgi:hypothetical protein
MTRRNEPGKPRRRIVSSLVAFIVLTFLASLIVIPAVADDGYDVGTALRALDEDYETRSAALPEGPARTALDLEYETAREQLLIDLGAVAPNGSDPSAQLGEDRPNIHPDGIHEANEDPEGYELTNFWVHEFQNGDYIYVMGASVDGNPTVGGVLVIDARGQEFFAAPDKPGPLRIESVEGSSLRLITEAGGVYRFDYDTKAFASG